jgi:hypothetical protein
MRSGQPYTAAGLAALWQTSMTRLSVEIEGHALGGGMLKLEPGEAAKVILTCSVQASIMRRSFSLTFLCREKLKLGC